MHLWHAASIVEVVPMPKTLFKKVFLEVANMQRLPERQQASVAGVR